MYSYIRMTIATICDEKLARNWNAFYIILCITFIRYAWFDMLENTEIQHISSALLLCYCKRNTAVIETVLHQPFKFTKWKENGSHQSTCDAEAAKPTTTERLWKEKWWKCECVSALNFHESKSKWIWERNFDSTDSKLSYKHRVLLDWDSQSTVYFVNLSNSTGT